MFTGIVERKGRITRLEPVGGRVELEVEIGADLAAEVRIGDSISLSGTCLTVVAVRGGCARFQVVPESLRITSLGSRQLGTELNVERAMRADGDDRMVRIECAPELAAQLVPKGSIAVEGVSLTAVSPDAKGFWVALIPHTRAVTTLGALEPGQPVNLELDVLGKYVFRYLAQRDRAANS